MISYVRPSFMMPSGADATLCRGVPRQLLLCAQPENCCVLIPGVRNLRRFITTGSWRNHTRELAALNKYQNQNPLAALRCRLTAVRDPIVVRVPKSLAVDGIVRLFRVSCCTAVIHTRRRVTSWL